jgi:membrane fusion protein, multidrug efflux system
MELTEEIMKRKLVLVIPLILFFFLSGCGPDTDTQEEVMVPVRVYSVKPESLTRYIKLNGTITAGQDQILYSKVSERISRLYVKAGDRVNTGQNIAEQYNAILVQGLDAARAGLNNAEAQYELVERDYDRMERLLKQRAISTQQFQQVETQRKAAQAALEAARAQLEQAQEQVANSIIKAPFSGVVASVYVEENQMLPAGQPFAQIIDPSSMKSKVRVAGRDISLIQRGQDVVVQIPSIPDKNYKGRIVSLNQAVDPVSKTLEAEVEIINADGNVKSGMYGEFMIASSSVRNTIVVPDNALLNQTEVIINRETGQQESVRRYFLFIVKENRAELREVKVGLTSEGRVQITDGINPNDTVIVVGNNIVQEGQTVNIID